MQASLQTVQFLPEQGLFHRHIVAKVQEEALLPETGARAEHTQCLHAEALKAAAAAAGPVHLIAPAGHPAVDHLIVAAAGHHTPVEEAAIPAEVPHPQDLQAVRQDREGNQKTNLSV